MHYLVHDFDNENDGTIFGFIEGVRKTVDPRKF